MVKKSKFLASAAAILWGLANIFMETIALPSILILPVVGFIGLACFGSDLDKNGYSPTSNVNNTTVTITKTTTTESGYTDWVKPLPRERPKRDPMGNEIKGFWDTLGW